MLELRNISKSYDGKTIINDVSFSVAEGETICLLGSSGSGKSTLLKIIAGLESPDSGEVTFDRIDLANTPPHLRDFGLVFQDYALFPHLNVFDNVAFGLKMRKLGQSEISDRVVTILGLVNLDGFSNRTITNLSGGEQQRVALARALAIRPRLLMFDEPLGALDRTLREGLLKELRTILQQTNIPAIYVTHDQEEAFGIADRVLILHEGNIIRDGTPAEVWTNPGSKYAAEFLGLGNVVEGEVVTKSGKIKTTVGNFAVRCNHKHSMGDQVHLLIRPLPTKDEANILQGLVTDVLFQQDQYKVTLDNGVYVYMNNPQRIGKKISTWVTVECLA